MGTPWSTFAVWYAHSVYCSFRRDGPGTLRRRVQEAGEPSRRPVGQWPLSPRSASAGLRIRTAHVLNVIFCRTE